MALLIFVLWVIFNGRIAADVIISGVLISAAITWFAKHYIGWQVTKSWRWSRVIPGAIMYFFLLIKEIAVANIAVMRLILDPKMEEKVAPQLARFPVDLKNNLVRALLANSITLTPGTITVVMRDDFYIIHALTPELAASQDMPFIKACRRLENAMSREEKKNV